MSAPTMRARKAAPADSNPPSSSTSVSPPNATINPSSSPLSQISVLDILRLLAGLALLSTTLSYFLTSTYFWTYHPWFTNPSQLHAYFITGPLHLTDAQLALYNGSNPALPILLALNGTIYDVTAGKDFYGPGGSYAFFAGRDATRAFVTGCFEDEEQLVGDLRGVEEMFLSVDLTDDTDGDVEGGGKTREWKRERKLRRERERRVARRKVWETVDGWRRLFDGGKAGKYFRRGVVDRGPGSGWTGWGEVRGLCEKARQGRPRRTADEVS